LIYILTNYNLIKQDARRSLKIKAVRMGGNAITGLKCENLADKGWQDEIKVMCRAEVVRIESREVLRELRGEPVISPVGTRNARKANQTESKMSGTQFGVGWLSRYGVIVTNYHIVKGRDKVSIGLPNGQKVRARLIKQDPGNNIAVLAPEEEMPGRKGLGLADSKASTGADVFVLGFSASPDLKKSPRIIKGVVNSTSGFRGDPRTYRITASLEKGYSGSPLLTPEGRVLGVVVHQGSATDIFPGQEELSNDQHLAVKLSYIRSILDKYPGYETGKGAEGQIATLRENIFTIIAE